MKTIEITITEMAITRLQEEIKKGYELELPPTGIIHFALQSLCEDGLGDVETFEAIDKDQLLIREKREDDENIFILWDYQDDMPLDEVNDAMQRLPGCRMYNVPHSYDDNNVVMASLDHTLTPNEVQAYYDVYSYELSNS